jgi:hypothetical protein
MSKRIEAKHKIDRRLGENLWGRPGSPLNARAYGPGQHGQRRKGKTSDYGLQLRAKQKLKGYYGSITEKAFKKLYTEASRVKGDTGERLIGLLESRSSPVTRSSSRSGRSSSASCSNPTSSPSVMFLSTSKSIIASRSRPMSACPLWPTCRTRCRWNRTWWSSSTRADRFTPKVQRPPSGRPFVCGSTTTAAKPVALLKLPGGSHASRRPMSLRRGRIHRRDRC